MKKSLFALSTLALIVLFASCGSVPSPSLSGVVSAVSNGGASIPTASAAIEFQNGEILASPDTSKMSDAGYSVGKVMTPATAATKNQAEVLFVEDGKKYWCNYVLNSRKATKADLVVGTTLAVLVGWAGHDDISADTYRKGTWKLGNVTSTEELFKNHVEVGGEQYNINYVRVPTDPIR